MASTKRPRACDACHSIKIKCELGTTGGPGPCERCVRLGKDCTVTPPKSQKDRVAELEAQVAALTKLLEGQNLASPKPTPNVGGSPSVADGLPANTFAQKKRKLAEDTTSSGESVISHLDQFDLIIPLDLQRELVEKYANIGVPMIPLVPLPVDWTLEGLREGHPILTQTILYSMSTGRLSEQDQDKLGSIVLDSFEALANESQDPLQLVQAMQVAVLWYRAPKNHRQIASFQLAQRAADIAKGRGWGDQSPRSLDTGSGNGEANPTAALRAYLACHVLSTAIVVHMRKSSFKSLPELDPFNLHMLEYLESSQKTDRTMCHFVRAENLCEKIVKDLNVLDFSVCEDVSDLGMQVKMQAFQNSIIDWSTQIPMSPPCPTLGLYEHTATLYLHETVLHTPTNKQSFAAPYLAERLSITDYPAQIIVTDQHVRSLNALKIAAHALIDLFSTFSLDIWASSPFLLTLGRVAYAEYILVKLYIATTAIGNTFGAFLDPSTLQVEKYLDQVIQIATAAQQVDPSCPAARLLLAPVRLKEWLGTYNASHGLVSTSSDYGSKEASPAVLEDGPFDWYNASLEYNTSDWDLDNLLTDPSTLDLFSES